MVTLKFYKVTSLPGTLEPNAIYLVENGDYTEAYVTSLTGEPKLLGNSQMIDELTTYINAGTF